MGILSGYWCAMADTIRERIIAAFTAQAAVLSNLSVERAQRSVGDSTERFVSVWDGDDQADTPNYGQQVMRMQIGIECIWQHGDENPSVSANVLMGEIAALMLGSDRTFGGLATSLALLRQRPEYPEDGGEYTRLTVTFSVGYTTVLGDPYTVPTY